MRIEVSIEGGFVAAPGLAKPIVLDTASLPPAETEACERLAREAVADAGTAAGRPQPLMRDGRSYRMKVDLDGRSVSLDASDGSMSPAFRQLLKLVRSHGSR
ncbi:protealysin inhibitor emfourin [Pseudoduganella umbonata]|uniref:Uncharacterized protein n=1 Tax=Pseudoduganella umbonata TaxID=864828 RepID=A0A4P8HK99_9BURK|nr:protealysin inhibitor emfourin [Pseudoduganella umbonata]MBB3220000.1 hypothetical protein [Pseudoduganella umbonata]QCP10007.1 hypothetical protein FCL38_05915 [Pseudoduganella umbonata]